MFFQNRGVPCDYLVREEGTKRLIFGLMCRGGRLWSYFLVACGGFYEHVCFCLRNIISFCSTLDYK